MTFDDALALILGWVGRDLSITILDHSSCGVIAVLSGQVHASHELTAEAATEDESVELPLDDDGGCTLVLDRPAFHGATGDEGGVEVMIGSVLIALAPCDID